MKARVYVTYKDGVLDPQGQTVCRFLQSHGEERVRDVRIGKYIEFEVEDRPHDELERMLIDISDKLLANPVIESYRVELP
ncbi:phosphoribosylformylglycinamidine synthase subunit PurS [candidate division KSB1 bacterium]|nr:phosphoribosylformylglycinamidine synthase subunit PurS [candidate division KSB1 bacterium]